MKGTLFSADFIKDADANLRLLEINTDSGFITNTLSSRFDFTDFISILQSNNITELVLVYKAFQQEFIEVLKTTIGTDATFITTVTEQVESVNTIYPSAVTDSSEKFILRLAYDENALLDSTYCKQRANVQKLFYDNSATGSIPEFYYSGSEYEVNTLRSNINDHSTLPDFVTKPKSEEHSALTFLNIGNTESSSADRIANLISHEDQDSNNYTIEKYHYNEEDVTEDGKVSGYRIVGIVYGSDIEYVTLGEWRVKSFLDIPSIKETKYLSNGDYNKRTLIDFDGTLPDGTPYSTASLTSLIDGNLGGETISIVDPDGSGYAMKIVTSIDIDPWQGSTQTLHNGDIDLTTDNKVVNVDVFSEVSTFILAKVSQGREGTLDSATEAEHGGSGWETLSFNFTNPTDNTVEASGVYGRLSFFPLWGGNDVWDDVSVTTTYYKNINGLKYHDNRNNFVDFYDNKHYFQLTSNYIRTTIGDAVYINTDILNPDNTAAGISTYEVSDVVKSIFINGLPDGDVASMYESWSSSGKSLPSGSFVTSSVVENLTEVANDRSYGIVGEIKLSETEVIYTSTAKHFLVYSTGSNAMSFKNQYKLDSTDDFLVDPSGSLIPIISNKVVILESNETGSLYQLDVETTDTYFVSSSVAPFIVHNAPCFVAGTKIHTENGVKNIEDVEVGEMVMTFNHDNDISEYKEVLEVMFKENECVITYVFEDGTELTGTKDHPLYVVGKGYASFEPQQTLDDSGLVVEQIEVGDDVKHLENAPLLITEIKEAGFEDVYNLKNVQDNHNFYANDLLVHNRLNPTCFLAGTEISLSNGDIKNIEDVIVGDVVESYIQSIHKNETIGRYESGIVTAIDHRHNVGSHADACNSLGDTTGVYSLNNGELMFTPEHPFLTKRGWASLVPISTQEPYLSQQDEELILSIGDFIIEDGKWVEIKTIEHHPMDVDTPVYNITVDVHHNYIANNIVVHNK